MSVEPDGRYAREPACSGADGRDRGQRGCGRPGRRRTDGRVTGPEIAHVPRGGFVARFTVAHGVTYALAGVESFVLEDYATAFETEEISGTTGRSAVLLVHGTPEVTVQMLVFSRLLCLWQRRAMRARAQLGS